MADAISLLKKYRAKGVLLDANLLVLYLVGRVNPNRIQSFKRTQSYSVEDYQLLVRLLGWFGALTTTPHVLSQASDLATPAEPELRLVRRELRSAVETAKEEYRHSRTVAGHALFERFGLADSAIASAADAGHLVLTDDLALQIEIERQNGDALNFNHLRQLSEDRKEDPWQAAKR
jgi:hypothetical protein